MNPLLGKHPSIGKVNTHFAGLLFANHMVYKFTSGPFQNSYFTVYVGLESVNVARNFSIGLNIRY